MISIRTVALCEVGENAPGVKTSKKSSKTPETYLVVTNDDAVLVRYLLIYFESKRSKNKSFSVWFKVFLFFAICALFYTFMKVLRK